MRRPYQPTMISALETLSFSDLPLDFVTYPAMVGSHTLKVVIITACVHRSTRPEFNTPAPDESASKCGSERSQLFPVCADGAPSPHDSARKPDRAPRTSQLVCAGRAASPRKLALANAPRTVTHRSPRVWNEARVANTESMQPSATRTPSPPNQIRTRPLTAVAVFPRLGDAQDVRYQK
ncbi:hypothetical protein B0H10DRAFT_2433523 [Mycena sp. CBHHK59/15]|nr:hypothetical protein B0H10DRAFT_2433523 [Mycena sp. CBHHK59/15]